MWYFFILGCIILGFGFSYRLIGHKKNINPIAHHIALPENTYNQNDTIKAMFSKKQIEKKLKHLAETPAPTDLSFGAMCYDMVARENTVHEYICPVCGEKTIYKKSSDQNKFLYIDSNFDEINECRREIDNIHGINIRLDETEFCVHCKPEIERPKLYLLVNIAGQKDTSKVSSFSYMDIRILQEFLDNKLVHKTDYDSETPLIENIGRIKELLGVK